MPQIELYGSDQCPYTRELRDWLDWTKREFTEYDVDRDPEAYARAQALVNGAVSVPILVEDNKVVQVGWQGRSCMVMAQKSESSSQADLPPDCSELFFDLDDDRPGCD